MTADSRPRRRTASVATAVAAVILTTGMATGCDDADGSKADNSLGCLRNAGTIADSLRAIHEAGLDAAKDPERTEESIENIENNLDKVDGGTADDKVGKAIDDLKDAIANYNKAVLDGDTAPDASRIDAAADALKNVCTS
ncbi:hypothetical protein OG828_44470 [Streptomyces sp. NBC_00457]|uniref:hypothetical protein n=1 Tax=unclassified Streptomyces TaxID=2593676 RepID=UPI002E1E6DA6|nr:MULTISPECIES: hypothetical protein [unclassified Streptomyces]